MRGGKLITATRNNTDNTSTNRTEITRKTKIEKKNNSMDVLSDSHEKTWTWLKKGNLKKETESLLIATQNNAIRTNHIKAIRD